MKWERRDNYETKDPEKRAFFALLRVIFKGEERMTGTQLSQARSARSGLRLNGGVKLRDAINFKLRGRAARHSGRKSVFSIVLTVLAFLFLAWCLLGAGLGLAAAGSPVYAIFVTAMILMLAMNILTGMFSAVSILYFPKDLSFYLSLPYTPKQITRAKFIHYFLLSLGGTLIFFPMVLGPLVVTGTPPLRFAAAALAYLAGAASLDLVMISLTIVVMRFTSFARDKDEFITLMSLLMMVVGVSIGVGLQFVLNGRQGGIHAVNAIGQLPLAAQIALAPVCPPILFARLLFAENIALSLLGLLFSLAGTALHLLLMSWLAERFYLPGVLAVQGSGGRKSTKKFTLAELSERLRPHKTMAAAYASIQLKKLRRVPIFFTQLLLMPMLMPLIMVVIFVVASLASLSGSDGFSLQTLLEYRRQLGEISLGTPLTTYIMLGSLGFVAVNCMGSVLPLRLAVSSDGQDFFMFKALPQGMKDYLGGIQQTMLRLTMAPSLILLLIFLVAAGIPFLPGLLILLYAALMAYIVSMVYLTFGAISPKFQWDSENALLRGSPQAVLLIYAGIFISALLAIPLVLLPVLNLAFMFMDRGAALCLSLVPGLGAAAAITAVYFGPAAKKLATFES